MEDNERVPLVAFGDAKFSGTMKGVHFASLAKRCRRLLKEAESRYEIVVVLVDEYFSSQVCSKASCRQRNMRNLEVDGGSGTLHSVKACNRYFGHL